MFSVYSILLKKTFFLYNSIKKELYLNKFKMLSSPFFFPSKKYNSSVNEDNYSVSQSSHAQE